MFKTGTLTAMPSIFPSNSGYIKVIALADPVVVGIKLLIEDLDLLRSFLGMSAITCVLVTSWIVVTQQLSIPNSFFQN